MVLSQTPDANGHVGKRKEIARPAETDARRIADAVPIRRIEDYQLRLALHDGLADLMAKRGDLLFVGLIYPIVGLVAMAFALNADLLPLLFPLAAGLSLLGPLVATGFYELARRRGAGLDTSWRHFVDVFRGPAAGPIMVIAVALIGIFAAWLVAASAIYAAFFGDAVPPTIGAFAQQVFGTLDGWAMIVAGNVVGMAFAILVLAVSVVSLPLLVDRRIDPAAAVLVSLRAFRENMGVLLRWGVIVGTLLVLGAIPLFVGLAFVLPWLGYSTWHLYGSIVDRKALAGGR